MSTPRPPPRFPAPSRAGTRERLASLRNPTPTPIRRPQPQQHQPQPPKPTTHPKTSTCPNPGCPAPNIVEDDGQKVCSGCGTVISEANIVSEVTFGETSSGAAVVQGTYVGAGQSHGRGMGPGFQRGGLESREITEQNGNRYIAQLSRALHVPESATKAAGQVFKLAMGLGFIQGRRTKTVAAISLYVACRRQEGNTIMLIDFADVLMINVFKLGRTYKALLDELRLGGNVFIMNAIDPESLIYRFAKQLEFGTSMMQVASDAVRIVQRMNRDWMITGRRPAGICGAALILAARMNNFRRTVREVVYVVKVTEITIHQRLNEFKATESGDLTVDQFRSVQLENAHDPPSFSHSKDPRRIAARIKKRKAPETAAEIENGDELDEISPEPPSPAAQPRRVDADGFAIPDIPIDPALLAGDKTANNVINPSLTSAVNDAVSELEEQPADAQDGPSGGKGKRGSKNQPPPPTEEELAAETALENEMAELLKSGAILPDNAPKPSAAPSKSDAADKPKVPKPVSSSEEIASDEFDSDPEVRYCLLSPNEVEIKERIWVHENKDYLRAQQAKALKRALEEEDAGGVKLPHKPRKRRKGRLGDVTYLQGEGGEGDVDGKINSRASTPAEATRLMLEQRGFSKKINYKLLEEMYDDVGGDKDKFIKRKESESDQARTPSRSVSRARSRSIRSVSVASDRSVGGSTLISRARERILKGGRNATPGAGARAVPAASPPPAKPAQHRTQPEATEAGPVAAEANNPDEEILGFIPGPEPGKEPENRDEEYDEDEEEEEEEEEYEDDRVDEAFEGNYYDDEGGYEEYD